MGLTWLSSRIRQQEVRALCALALLCAGSCHKEPRREIVKPTERDSNNKPTPSQRDGGTPEASGMDGGPGAGRDSGTTDGAAEPNAGRGGDEQPDPAGDDGNENQAGTDGAEGQAGDESEPPIETPPFTKLGLLEAAADCALEHYRAFEGKARVLRAATQQAADGGGTELGDARAAWLEANAAWQRAELFRFGPAAASTDPGGQDLRDQIYIFPYANSCLVDQRIVDQGYADVGGLLGSARGITALEYLLFQDGADNSCPASNRINTRGEWTALSAADRATRRAAYAAAAATDVVERAQGLIAAMDPAEGNFRAQLTAPGENGSVFATDQDALNAVSNAVFYVEQEIKDWKLGKPLGIAPECPNMATGGTCPDDTESRYARVSTENIAENLVGLRQLFQGCGPQYSGLGFDDWLIAIGADDLAGRMISAIEGAQAATQELEPKLEEAIVSDPAKVRTVHTAVKAFTDLLKGEFVSLLNLDVPMSSVGDND